jgi:hypothetical protein
MEKWKKKSGIDGYEFSSYGRCKTLARKMWNGFGWWYSEEKIMKPSTSRGYLCYVISQDKKRIAVAAHRAVAELFIPNPNNLPEVNHKDLNKHNNHHSNLEWMTHYNNMRHAYDNGAFEK